MIVSDDRLVTRWEYRTIPWHADTTWGGKGGMDGLAKMLTDMGAEGWDMAGCFNAGPDVGYLIFKRPAPIL